MFNWEEIFDGFEQTNVEEGFCEFKLIWFTEQDIELTKLKSSIDKRTNSIPLFLIIGVVVILFSLACF